jgi:hypothetical protein
MHKLIKVDKNGKKTYINVPDWADFQVVDGMFGPGTGSQEVIVPFVGSQPVSKTVAAGSFVSLNANIGPSGPFDGMIFTWKSGSNKILVDGKIFSGSSSPTLTISTASAASAGNYYLSATSSYGAITSSIATLTVA